MRAAILSGELRSGAQYSIYQISEQLGVSRTPVRDAVLRLADAGLLRIEKNRGIRICGVTIDGIQDIIEARLLIEVPAAASAARTVDDERDTKLGDLLTIMIKNAKDYDTASFSQHDRQIHRTILGSSGNERLVSIVESLRDATQVLGASTLGKSRSLHEVQNEHVPIVQAIAQGNPGEAAHCMSSHLVATGRLLMEQVSHRTGVPVPAEWVPRVWP